MQYTQSHLPPAVRRRHDRAAAFATRILDRFAAGITGTNLSQSFLLDGPADLNHCAEGHTARCYGIETPPQRSATAAVLTWANMARGVTS